MSRIGRLPITVPAGVTVTIAADNTVTVKEGPKGQLSQKVDPEITVTQEGGMLHVARPSDDKNHRALHGLYRSLIHNMVVGRDAGLHQGPDDGRRGLSRTAGRHDARADRGLFPSGQVRGQGRRVV